MRLAVVACLSFRYAVLICHALLEIGQAYALASGRAVRRGSQILRGPRDGNPQLVRDVEWPVRLAQAFAGEEHHNAVPFLKDGVGLDRGGYQPDPARANARSTATFFDGRDLIAATDY